MQKMVQFYHQKEIDILKLECTLPNLANMCLHKSANEKFYPYCEKEGDLCEKIREDMTGRPSTVFTRKAVMDKTFIKDSSRIHQPALSLFKTCQHDCTQDRSLIPICKKSRLDISNLAILRNGDVLLARNKTRMRNWELTHIWKSNENWLLQCRWILLSLQNSFWTCGVLLPFLSLPGDSSVI